jgi:hypothetical protein
MPLLSREYILSCSIEYFQKEESGWCFTCDRSRHSQALKTHLPFSKRNLLVEDPRALIVKE